MPAVAVCDEPPAIPASGRSELPDAELQSLEFEAEAVRGNLCQRRPGTLAHVLSAELDQTTPVAPQNGPGLALEHDGREDRGAETPTDQEPVLVTHLSRRQRPPRPAKTRRTLRVALPQRLGGERLARDRLDLGVIIQAEFQRVDAGRLRHLIDRAFQCNAAARLSGRAHEHWSSRVQPYRLGGRGDSRAGVERVADLDSGLEEIVEAARGCPHMVVDRRQRAVAVGAEAERLACRRSMADRAVHLFPAQHQLHRPPDQAGGQDAQHLRPRDHALGAEAATQEGAADQDILRRDPEQPGDPPHCPGQALARRVHQKTVTVPGGDDGVRFHGVVVLGWGLVDRLDPVLRCCQPGVDIAVTHLGRRADADRWWDEAVVAVQPDPRRLRLIAWRQQHRAFRRRLQRLGDHHRNRLTSVAHPVVLQQVEAEHKGVQLRIRIQRQRRAVRRGHYLDDAGMGFCCRNIEEAHAAAGDAAHRDGGVQHAGRMVVRRITGLTGDLQ